jgi:hypothetical protein
LKSELPPPKVNILLAGESFHSMLSKLKGLMAHENAGSPEQIRFDRWAESMSKATKRRNEAIHSAWLDLTHVSPEALAKKWPGQVPPELIRLKPAKSLQKNSAVPGHPATVSELEQLAKELAQLAEDVKQMQGNGLFDPSGAVTQRAGRGSLLEDQLSSAQLSSARQRAKRVIRR